MRDSLSSERKKVQSVSVLWRTFCTHSVMQDYMSYNIEHHPSISSEYVKFLVLNHGSSSESENSGNNGVESKLSDLQAKVVTVEKIAKATREKQSSTANSLAQLKERVATLE